MYTVEQLESRIALARAAKLSGAELLEDIPRAMRVCNGIGAYWMPESVRDAISGLNPTLVLAADIHDIRYYLGGTEADREFADNEMLSNGLALADYHYRWYDPRRYWVRKQMRKFYLILRAFGRAAFRTNREAE